MAEVRKSKSDNTVKPRARGARAPSAARVAPAELKRLMLETQDQLALIHGVLEELCERQEAMSAWQMEFSKRLVNLQEAQWRSLEDLAGIDMGDPVSKAFGVPLEPDAAEDDVDGLNEANKMMEQINSEATSKRAMRMQKKKDPLRRDDDDSVSAESSGEGSSLRQENRIESVFVVPTKVDVH
ncbi:MAG: hypothetical protein RJB13_2353 [Pseudomonadota bacterium]|jgi:hypothetical protein